MADRELARESYPPYPDVHTVSGGLLRIERRHNAAGGIQALKLVLSPATSGSVMAVELTGGEARTIAFQLRDAAERWFAHG